MSRRQFYVSGNASSVVEHTTQSYYRLKPSHLHLKGPYRPLLEFVICLKVWLWVPSFIFDVEMCSCKNSTCELQTTHFMMIKNYFKQRWILSEEMFLFSTFSTSIKIAANIALINFQTILCYLVVCGINIHMGGGGGIGFGKY